MEPSLPRLMDRGIHVSRIRRAGGGTGGKSPGLPTPRNEKCPIYSEKNPQIEFLLRMGFWKNAWHTKRGHLFKFYCIFIDKGKGPVSEKIPKFPRKAFLPYIWPWTASRRKRRGNFGHVSPYSGNFYFKITDTVFIQNWYIPVGNQPTSISWTVRRASPSFSSSAERSRTDSSTCGGENTKKPTTLSLVKKNVLKISSFHVPAVQVWRRRLTWDPLPPRGRGGAPWTSAPCRGDPCRVRRRRIFFKKKPDLDSLEQYQQACSVNAKK